MAGSGKAHLRDDMLLTVTDLVVALSFRCNDRIRIQTMKSIRNIGLAIGLALISAPALADDAALKERLETCKACHGEAGASKQPEFPILAGQDEKYLAKTLKLYHGGDRTSPAMQAMSFLMAESDIDKLAAYYARQPAN